MLDQGNVTEFYKSIKMSVERLLWYRFFAQCSCMLMCELIKMCLFFPKNCARTSEIFQINKQYLYMFDSQLSNLFLGGLNKYWVSYI